MTKKIINKIKNFLEFIFYKIKFTFFSLGPSKVYRYKNTILTNIVFLEYELITNYPNIEFINSELIELCHTYAHLQMCFALGEQTFIDSRKVLESLLQLTLSIHNPKLYNYTLIFKKFKLKSLNEYKSLSRNQKLSEILNEK